MNRTTPLRFLWGILVALSVYAWYAYTEARSPDKIFTAAWGSINAVAVDSYFPAYFDRYRELQKSGTLLVFSEKEKNFVPASSFVEYFTANDMDRYAKRIEKLRKVSPAEDGKELVAAAIDLYGFMDGLYKTDFLRVTEMMDAGVPEGEIEDHLAELHFAKVAQISEKYDTLLDLLVSYSDKHGIEFKVH